MYMKATKRTNLKKLDIKVILMLGIFLVAFVLWDFFYDSASQEAIDFYSYSSKTEIDKNGAFALKAIAAPVLHPDPFRWAVNEYAAETKMPYRLQLEKDLNAIAKNNSQRK